jgi:hypothetical protein
MGLVFGPWIAPSSLGNLKEVRVTRAVSENTMEVAMVIIAILGGLFLSGAVLAGLKRVGEPSDSREKRLHIV